MKLLYPGQRCPERKNSDGENNSRDKSEHRIYWGVHQQMARWDFNHLSSLSLYDLPHVVL